MNARVPSIGSMNHVYSPAPARSPSSSATMPCVGIARDDRRPQHALDRAVGVRHGIERVRALVLDRDRLPKVCLRDAARRVGELQCEVLELDDRDLRHDASTALSVRQRCGGGRRLNGLRRRTEQGHKSA